MVDFCRPGYLYIAHAWVGTLIKLMYSWRGSSVSYKLLACILVKYSTVHHARRSTREPPMVPRETSSNTREYAARECQVYREQYCRPLPFKIERNHFYDSSDRMLLDKTGEASPSSQDSNKDWWVTNLCRVRNAKNRSTRINLPISLTY